MGNVQTINRINFEDMQQFITRPSGSIIINTMSAHDQSCLIKNTTPAIQEEGVMDKCLERKNYRVRIIVYGQNANDITIFAKHQQLTKMGFVNVHIYPGGLFEWLLLQDIYGEAEFPTTTRELDILKYKGSPTIHENLLEY